MSETDERQMMSSESCLRNWRNEVLKRIEERFAFSGLFFLLTKRKGQKQRKNKQSSFVKAQSLPFSNSDPRKEKWFVKISFRFEKINETKTSEKNLLYSTVRDRQRQSSTCQSDLSQRVCTELRLKLDRVNLVEQVRMIQLTLTKVLPVDRIEERVVFEVIEAIFSKTNVNRTEQML